MRDDCTANQAKSKNMLSICRRHNFCQTTEFNQLFQLFTFQQVLSWNERLLKEYQRDLHPLCKTVETGDEDTEPAWTASPVCGVQGKVSTQHAPHSFQHSKRSDHSTPQCVCGTLHSNNTELMDSMLVTPLRLSLPLLFHVASMGNPLRGAAHWLLVQMVKSIPVCSGVGALRPGGLLPSVPILSSLLI